MSTVICSNCVCGKEYHDSFKKCPFCGTVNTQYREPVANDEPKPKEMNAALRVLISTVVAAVALFLCALFVTAIGWDGSIGKALIAGIAIAVWTFTNNTLKHVKDPDAQKKI